MAVDESSWISLTVGGSSRPELRAQLAAAGIELNALAETLLEHPHIEQGAPVSLALARRSVGELGMLPQVIAAARGKGLELCPPATGPYLRLAVTSQAEAPDTVLSAGRAPSGALTVLSGPSARITSTRRASICGSSAGCRGCAVSAATTNTAGHRRAQSSSACRTRDELRAVAGPSAAPPRRVRRAPRPPAA